ncbi:MAG: carbon-nitrogen hydrolase family protein [Methanobacteriota archaeon]|nr:MAG: carbon-nitrogen hydrolase family protein [Euryarchaeota archaeon]
MKVRISSAQIAPSWGNVKAGLAVAEKYVQAAASADADLCCFPEQFAAGWSPQRVHAAESTDGLTVATLSALAREHSIALLGSFVEVHGMQPRNTAVAIDADGRVLATYSKIHLFTPGGEHEHYAAGENLACFDVNGMRFGIAICYDLRFPEIFSLYAAEAAACILVPSAWPCSRIRHFELFVQARALENQYYVCGINAVGTTPVDRYCGHSLCADPHGEIVACAGAGPELMVATLDTDAIEGARRRLPVRKDRKDALYQSLFREREP